MFKVVNKKLEIFLFKTCELRNFAILVSIASLVCCFTRCKKIVDVDPPITGLSSKTVFTNDVNAASAVTGIFQSIMVSPGEFSGGNIGISLKLGVACDELKVYSSDNSLEEIYTNKIQTINSINYASWAFYYKYIYECNAVIENLNASSQLSASTKGQLLGEVKFMRALLYFYLENLYGEVPLILTTDYRRNSTAKRSDTVEINRQIIADILDAQTLLTPEYKTPSGQTTSERVRPNRNAVSALLARISLYQKDWHKAETASTEVIDDSRYELLNDLTTVFGKNSTEAILQFQPTGPGFNTYDGYSFILDDNFNSNSPAALAQSLVSSFEANDQRFRFWVGNYNGYYFTYKYRIKGGGGGSSLDEYTMVLRLAEQYLIRAEARAQLGDLNKAVTDINIIRKRAGLDALSGNLTKDSILSVIMHERQTELFAEWGHRWFDLKRTGRLDAVMESVAPSKNTVWRSFAKLFPIPSTEIVKNPVLTQNPGY